MSASNLQLKFFGPIASGFLKKVYIYFCLPYHTLAPGAHLHHHVVGSCLPLLALAIGASNGHLEPPHIVLDDGPSEVVNINLVGASIVSPGGAA